MSAGGWGPRRRSNTSSMRVGDRGRAALDRRSGHWRACIDLGGEVHKVLVPAECSKDSTFIFESTNASLRSLSS